MNTVPPNAALFGSTSAYRGAFESGLERLLDIGGLNLFILVAANASFDAALFADLRGPLHNRFTEQSARLRETFSRGSQTDDADDDLLVFLKMACAGFEALQLTERRSSGPWEVQFNHLRSFRPLRDSRRPMASIHVPFNPAAFNFNKPFLQQEALWSGEMLGRHVDLYYNKYPFVELHSLLVPEREQCLPQYHRQDMHEFAWDLVRQLADGMPGIRIGFNAMGAFASVNHLHYQVCVRDDPLPVELPQWSHNGGVELYPVECRAFDDVAAAWACIDVLHAGNHAYNLLYTPRRMYCLLRRKQAEFPLAPWSNGFSWYEMSGGLITFARRDYESLNAPEIEAQLRLARLENVMA